MFNSKISRGGNYDYFENNLPKNLRKSYVKQIIDKQLVICSRGVIEKKILR
jgi:hypothetical protein